MKRALAKAIVFAQVASDGGKHIRAIAHFSPLVWSRGYDDKDAWIQKAIDLILKDKPADCHFYVSKDSEIANCIVYFTFTIDGKRYQCSFHSFNLEFLRYSCSKCASHWDEKSSRDAVCKLWEKYCLDGKDRR